LAKRQFVKKDELAMHRKGLARPVKVRALKGCRIHLTYSDGVAGEVDLSHLANRGVFKIWRNREIFEAPKLTAMGAVAWGQDIELCPDALRMQMTGKSPAELMSEVRRLSADA